MRILLAIASIILFAALCRAEGLCFPSSFETKRAGARFLAADLNVVLGAPQTESDIDQLRRSATLNLACPSKSYMVRMTWKCIDLQGCAAIFRLDRRTDHTHTHAPPLPTLQSRIWSDLEAKKMAVHAVYESGRKVSLVYDWGTKWMYKVVHKKDYEARAAHSCPH